MLLDKKLVSDLDSLLMSGYNDARVTKINDDMDSVHSCHTRALDYRVCRVAQHYTLLTPNCD
jgi:hypothetical protein